MYVLFTRVHSFHTAHQNALVVTHTYKEAHTHPQACRHSGILALRVVSPPIEHSEPPSSVHVKEDISFSGWDDPRLDEKVSGGSLLGHMWGGRRVPPETPAPFGVLLAQDLFFTFTLLLRAQITVFLFQKPHRRPALFLKMPLVFYREKGKSTQKKKKCSGCSSLHASSKCPCYCVNIDLKEETSFFFF